MSDSEYKFIIKQYSQEISCLQVQSLSIIKHQQIDKYNGNICLNAVLQ